MNAQIPPGQWSPPGPNDVTQQLGVFGNPPPQPPPRRRVPTWVIVVTSVVAGVCATALVIAGLAVSSVLSDNKPPTAADAIAGCQQLIRQNLANPSTATFDTTPWKVVQSSPGKWDVIGGMNAKNQVGVYSQAGYACIGLYKQGGDWYADSKATRPL